MAYITFDDTKNKTGLSEIFNLLYPVGVYYITEGDSPEDIFARLGLESTWELVQGKFLLGSSSSYTVGSEGGEETHTLIVSEMPSHSHSYTNYPNSGTRGWGGTFTDGQYYGTATSQTTGSTGGGGAHNNMPPYRVVDIYKRIS